MEVKPGRGRGPAESGEVTVTLPSEGSILRRRGRPPSLPDPERVHFRSRQVSLPDFLWPLLEQAQRLRGDSSLSSTIRVLLCRELAQIGLLPEEVKRAYGAGG